MTFTVGEKLTELWIKGKHGGMESLLWAGICARSFHWALTQTLHTTYCPLFTDREKWNLRKLSNCRSPNHADLSHSDLKQWTSSPSFSPQRGYIINKVVLFNYKIQCCLWILKRGRKGKLEIGMTCHIPKLLFTIKWDFLKAHSLERIHEK